mmetsp:Transcript_5358/g.7478  ORF Transcript_5358/g.7478 Transcript_5358/m.7478 type:complete len:301 (+) Transcript_5358:633-1535(+)
MDTVRPLDCRYAHTLASDVDFPTPFTPMNVMTYGRPWRFEAWISGRMLMTLLGVRMRVSAFSIASFTIPRTEPKVPTVRPIKAVQTESVIFSAMSTATFFDIRSDWIFLRTGLRSSSSRGFCPVSEEKKEKKPDLGACFSSSSSSSSSSLLNSIFPSGMKVSRNSCMRRSDIFSLSPSDSLSPISKASMSSAVISSPHFRAFLPCFAGAFSLDFFFWNLRGTRPFARNFMSTAFFFSAAVSSRSSSSASASLTFSSSFFVFFSCPLCFLASLPFFVSLKSFCTRALGLDASFSNCSTMAS